MPPLLDRAAGSDNLAIGNGLGASGLTIGSFCDKLLVDLMLGRTPFSTLQPSRPPDRTGSRNRLGRHDYPLPGDFEYPAERKWRADDLGDHCAWSTRTTLDVCPRDKVTWVEFEDFWRFGPGRAGFPSNGFEVLGEVVCRHEGKDMGFEAFEVWIMESLHGGLPPEPETMSGSSQSRGLG